MPPVQFGFCAPIFAQPGAALFRTPNYAQLDPAQTVAIAREADTLGFDSLWVADHLMLGQDEAILEGWTVLAALAGSTTQARLGIIHQANLMRHPALAAKMAATLDQISGGRLIHFYDCSNNRREHVAYGLPWVDSAEERIARMVEALELTLALWQQDAPFTYNGRFYHVADAVCAPKPVQRPHPPIWLGEDHPDMLAACARLAQGWNSVPVGLATLEQRLGKLAAACAAAGRDPATVEKSLEIQILVAPDHAALRAQLRDMIGLGEAAAPAWLVPYLDGATDALPAQLTNTMLLGTPAEVTRQLEAYMALGISHFMLWFLDAPNRASMHLFVSHVRPHMPTKETV